MIYLDYQATTPLAPEAREAMLRWMGGPGNDTFGNPHSPHRMGRMAAAAIEHARGEVAALFPPGGQVIFTSGATEAVQLALRGVGGPVAASAIEHAAVLDTARALGTPHLIPVDAEGLTDPAAPLPEGVRAIAVMQVNNEIGTVQPVAAWHERARALGVPLLVDGVQAAGKLPLAAADLIAISAHKMHGPKGIGALWVGDGLALAPASPGGGQERGLRSGTLSPALCAGFGAAATLALARRDEDAAHCRALWQRARDMLGGWTLNGSAAERWPGNLNIRRAGLDVGRLMSECRQVMFSAGSACASGSGRPSHVLAALGLTPAQARNSLRLGFGRYTTLTELEEGAGMIAAAAEAQGL